MVAGQNFKENVSIFYYTDSTKVTNSYLLTKEEIKKVAEQIEFSRHVTYDWKCLHIRTANSYKYEIKAHNNLYNLGLFKSHTIDTDLNENMTIFEKIAYFILGR